jgi:PAS domain S-box-containing protein
MTAPVIAACLLAGAGLYLAVMTSIERFSEDQMRYFVTEAKQDIFAACDRTFTELSRSPLARDAREGRIRRAHAIGAIEDLLREKKMVGFLREGDRTLALNRPLAPDLAAALETSTAGGAFALVEHGGGRYAASIAVFPDWNWRVVIAKSTRMYAAMAGGITRIAVHIAVIVLLAGTGVLIALSASIRRPFDALLASVRSGGRPSATGIRELDELAERMHEAVRKRNALIGSVEQTHFLYSHDVNGNFTYLSASITDLLGYTPGEFQTHYTSYLTDHPVNREVVRHTTLSIQGQQQPPYAVEVFHKDGSRRWLEVSEVPVRDGEGRVVAVEGIAHDITRRKEAETERERLIADLRKALAEIKTLRGIIPICASCKKIRDDQGAWQQIEAYLHEHADAEFSHGICPDCFERLYPPPGAKNKDGP